jgi:hypothetical protein
MSRHYKFDKAGKLIHSPSTAVFQQLPSVTTIISDCTDKSGALTQWSANMVCAHIRENCETPNVEGYDVDQSVPDYFVMEADLEDARFNFREVSKTALNIGSAVHAAIEDYLMTGKDFPPKNVDSRITAGLAAFMEWFEKNDVKVIAVEETVRGNYWAGTLDLLCTLNGVLYVIDFKTSKAIYPADMGPQIAAYRSACYHPALLAGNGDFVEGSGILRLDKETGLPEWKDFSKRYESDLNVFNKMVELYFARHPQIRKKAGYNESV